jgi:hypothetical protein
MTVMLLALVIFIVTVVVGVVPMSSVLSSDPDSPALLFTVAKRYEPLAWVRGADRFSSDAIIFVQDASGRHPLIPGLAASADPTVSFDVVRGGLCSSLLLAGGPRCICEEDRWPFCD